MKQLPADLLGGLVFDLSQLRCTQGVFHPLAVPGTAAVAADGVVAVAAAQSWW